MWKAFNSHRRHSMQLDSLNTQPVQMFHLILEYPNEIYHLPDCGAVIVAAQNEDTLVIADIVTDKQITLKDIIPELPFIGVRQVEFGFCPDWLGVSPRWTPVDIKEEPFFLRGNWNLPEKFRFPVLSET